MELLSVFIFAGLILLFPTAYAAKIGAPYVPTFSPALKKAFDYIKLNDRDVVVDLGAGDGKILLAARKRGAKVIGYELSPVMWLITWLRLATSPLAKGDKKFTKPRVYLRNFYKQTLPEETTVIYAFLMPETMIAAKKALSQQALPKLRFIVIYAFPFKDIQPLKTIHTPKCARMFIYEPNQLVNKPKSKYPAVAKAMAGTAKSK